MWISKAFETVSLLYFNFFDAVQRGYFAATFQSNLAVFGFIEFLADAGTLFFGSRSVNLLSFNW